MGLSSKNFQVENKFDFTIEKLKDAALSRDRFALEKYLENLEVEEDNLRDKAYFHYFKGYFLIHFGGVNKIDNHLEIGKNELTLAIDCFKQSDLIDNAIEAQISLGWSYYLSGEISSYEAFLLDALSQCSDETSDSYFSVCVSLLIVYFKDLQSTDRIKSNTAKYQALALIKNLENQIYRCSNKRIICQFYHNAARIYRLLKDFQSAFKFYQFAIKQSQSLKNKQFEALSYNSLAHCYLDAGLFDLAIESIDYSIDIFKSLKIYTSIAYAMDSKASILLAQNKLDEALTTINGATTYCRRQVNWDELAEILWNKIKILFRLKKKLEIVETITQLGNAIVQLDLDRRNYYYQKIQEIVVIPFGDTLKEKQASFNKQIILPVINNTKNNSQAAKELGISHQTLRNTIERLEVEKQPRKRRTDARHIIPIPKVKTSFLPIPVPASKCKYFRVAENIASCLGFNSEVIIAVYKVEQLNEGDLILVEDFEELIITELIFEEGKYQFLDLSCNVGFCITNKTALWLGRIIGVAPAKDLQNETIYFQKI